MAAITPDGFQNHMMNPLAHVLWAVLSGAQDMRRDEREHRMRQQDRSQQGNETLRMALARAGVNPIGDTGEQMTEPEMLSQLAQVQSDSSRREQELRDREVKLRELDTAHRNMRDAASMIGRGLDRTATQANRFAGTLSDALGHVMGNGQSGQEWAATRGRDGTPILYNRKTGQTAPLAPGRAPRMPPAPGTAGSPAPQPAAYAAPEASAAPLAQPMQPDHDPEPLLRSLSSNAGIDDTGGFAPILGDLTGPDPARRAEALRSMPAVWRLRAIYALRRAGLED